MNLTTRLRALVLFIAACGGAFACSATSTSAEADYDAVHTGSCKGGTAPECVMECGSEVTLIPKCTNGAWVCDQGVDIATCACTGGYPTQPCVTCDGGSAAKTCNPQTKAYECAMLTCDLVVTPFDAGADAAGDARLDGPTE